MYTEVLQHVVERDKQMLLCEKEPIARRKGKLQYVSEQMAQCEKDRLEYVREMKMMEKDFKQYVSQFESLFLNERNLVERENKEALETNQYKELYKMEIMKREEEHMERERGRRMGREEQKNAEVQERIRQEQLRIETEKDIGRKEEDFKKIQMETLVKKID